MFMKPDPACFPRPGKIDLLIKGRDSQIDLSSAPNLFSPSRKHCAELTTIPDGKKVNSMRKTIPVLILAIALSLGLSLHKAHSGAEPERRCTDSSGRLLYVVRREEVRDKSGRLLGTVKFGEVRDASGRLLAHQGDPGLLFCWQKDH
jgi:hypothetical protein